MLSLLFNIVDMQVYLQIEFEIYILQVLEHVAADSKFQIGVKRQDDQDRLKADFYMFFF